MKEHEVERALAAARRGDGAGVGELLGSYRGRIRRMVDLRMDPRLGGRVDASDVVQEAYVEVLERLPAYEEQAGMPFFLWVRFIAGQKLQQFHRRHLGVAGRDLRREVPLLARIPGASSLVLANVIVESGPSPCSGAALEEQRQLVRAALDTMQELDREILVMRHFEQLKNAEIARILGLEPATASRRYLRAVARLRGFLPITAGGESSGER